MAAHIARPIKHYAAPFAPEGVVHGVDFALVDHGFARFAPLTETGRSYQSVLLSQHDDGRYVFNLNWQEERADGAKGRFCRVTIALGGRHIEDKANMVMISSCHANTSRKKAGMARCTLDLAAIVADPIDAAIWVCADDDGREAWLALGGQPEPHDHQQNVRKARRLKIDDAIVARLRARDYIGVRRDAPEAFAAIVMERPAWDGGWTREQVREIATKAR